MNKGDIDLMMGAVAPVVKRLIEAAVQPLAREIAELKALPRHVPFASGVINRHGVLILTLADGKAMEMGTVVGKDGEKGERGESGERGRDGVDGKDGLPGERGAIGEKGEPGEDGKDGADGKDGRDGVDGKDADESAIEARVWERFEQKWLQALPTLKGDRGEPGPEGAPGERGEKGEKGDPGISGKDGLNGRDGIDGKDGAPGEKGDPGVDGQDGQAGPAGKDGRGIQSAFINKSGHLVVVYTDGETDELDCVVGKDGRNADDVVIDRVIERLVAMGDQWRGKDGTSIIYRGVWSQGETYELGNAATFGGSLWIKVDAGDEKPGDGKTWKLAVKKGRDARKTKGDE